MRPTAACLSRQSVLEVERKFRCVPGTIHLLRANKSTPAFHSLVYCGQRSFEDTYYDNNAILSSNGIWVRKRNERWQAKIRQGGDYMNSQFQEFSGADQISYIVRKYCAPAAMGSMNFGLLETARYVTLRHELKADDTFRIVLDTTNFGHSVGEVELQHLTGAQSGESQNVATMMDAQIVTFMQHYAWAFPKGNAVGKLSAYFAWRSREES